mmetsp:Transcript_101820/g.276796  ORF Transcript_101820/g.276796 Transcript_101820/m.276796 type:complete len:334 (-) Transcript_101820:116-1117(-)
MSQFGAPSAYGQARNGAAYGAFSDAGTPMGYSSPYVKPFTGPHTEKEAFQQGTRRRLNSYAIWISLVAPWLLFTVMLGLVSFPIHYNNPGVVYLAVGIGLVAVVFIAVYTLIDRTTRSNSPEREPSWLLVLSLALALAWMLGVALGFLNYVNNTLPYQQIIHLNSYSDVNPTLMRGAQLMDAGSVMFTESSYLNLDKSMGFKNQETYCVAPIVQGAAEPATYDFWAVGTDCCSEHSADFACGEYDNPDARSGLRLTSTSQKEYYALAVEQAEATYGVKASNPVFMTWMQDPDLEVGQYWTDATRFFALVAILYGLFQAALVAGMLTVLSKLGW